MYTFESVCVPYCADITRRFPLLSDSNPPSPYTWSTQIESIPHTSSANTVTSSPPPPASTSAPPSDRAFLHSTATPSASSVG